MATSSDDDAAGQADLVDPGFDQSKLDGSVVALPLLERLQAGTPQTLHRVIIDLHLRHPEGLEGARAQVHRLLGRAAPSATSAQLAPQYVFAQLTFKGVRDLVAADREQTSRAVYKVWPDFEVSPLLTESVATVKADAARIAFSADGHGIVWAIADTGVEQQHRHFMAHDNLRMRDGIAHMDFTGPVPVEVAVATDPNGHGTHVAGIVAGEVTPAADAPADDQALWVAASQRTESGDRTVERWQAREPIRGVAPRASILSLRVLDDAGNGHVSNLIQAIGYIQQLNHQGRMIRVHGLNLSVGYGFDPEWFGCGQSPLCVAVDQLVRTGVAVVTAAGNTGYLKRGGAESNKNAGLSQTINDPGNAALAITVGATHRRAPHTYGVSYFSSKGPTGDGRSKPDLVAPGERIISCAAGAGAAEVEGRSDGRVHYREWSGTSMAAPHVSGAIAALLSIRSEFVGQPERVKALLLDSATDLGREPYFQGAGLLDLMRAIQAV